MCVYVRISGYRICIRISICPLYYNFQGHHHHTPHTYPDQTRKVPSLTNTFQGPLLPPLPSCTPKPQCQGLGHGLGHGLSQDSRSHLHAPTTHDPHPSIVPVPPKATTHHPKTPNPQSPIPPTIQNTPHTPQPQTTIYVQRQPLTVPYYPPRPPHSTTFSIHVHRRRVSHGSI
jgi:hypothetical protein